MEINEDITKSVKFTNYEDQESSKVALLKCACGKEFQPHIFPLYVDDGGEIKECPECHRKIFFDIKIRIFEKRTI